MFGLRDCRDVLALPLLIRLVLLLQLLPCTWPDLTVCFGPLAVLCVIGTVSCFPACISILAVWQIFLPSRAIHGRCFICWGVSTHSVGISGNFLWGDRMLVIAVTALSCKGESLQMWKGRVMVKGRWAVMQ